MRNLLVLLLLTLSSPTFAGGQLCFLDEPPDQRDPAKFETRMQALALALMPIEYRNSCQIRDENDERFYQAIRLQTGCESSENFDNVFGQYLTDEAQFVFAVNRVDLRTDEDYNRYCEVVKRIDISKAVNKQGLPESQVLQSQAPLIFALQELVATRRWQK